MNIHSPQHFFKDIFSYVWSSLLLLIGHHSTGQTQPSATGNESPNIIYILADDLGYGDLGCYGAKDINTPNIDRIAHEGIRFTEFYSASPISSPSRASLLTGRYPQRMGINGVFFPDSYTGMSPSEITIAENLKTKKYSTAIIGKWHLGSRQEFLPLQQGFDEYFGIPYSNDMSSVVYMRGNQVESYQVDQRLITQTYTTEAIRFIEKNKSKPFFLYLAHTMPHVPLYVSDHFKGSSKRGLYGDVVQELDWSVGQILDELTKLGLLENTLIVFSSDNGPWLEMDDMGGLAGVLREGKMTTFEGGMRVPAVAMWKGKIQQGKIYSDLITEMDWFPTFAHITGSQLPTDRPIDGCDITNVLTGNGKRSNDKFLYFMCSDLQAFRAGDWKIKLPSAKNKDTLLVNLKKDPGEKNNLFTQNPVEAHELLTAMQKKKAALGELPPSLIIRTDADRSHINYLEKKRSGK